MNTLQKLQEWYESECNEDWEHTYGVSIETLDNPGWYVRIDLAETELHDRPFVEVQRGSSEEDRDWIHCKVEKGKFVAMGGVANLDELLQTFLAWAKS